MKLAVLITVHKHLYTSLNVFSTTSNVAAVFLPPHFSKSIQAPPSTSSNRFFLIEILYVELVLKFV